MAEIFGKKFISINDDVFSVGDTIDYLRWEMDEEGTENEIYQALIRDIAEDHIIVSDGNVGDIKIDVDSIF
ncbi:MAG: hypothetical protein ACI4GD_02175 [Lachnospiraceae bacterium]